MNILIASIDYKPQDGGIAEFMYNTAKILSTKEHKVFIVAPIMKDCDEFDSRHKIFTYRLLNIVPPNSFSLRRIILYFPRFIKMLINFRKIYFDFQKVIKKNDVNKIILFHWEVYGLVAYFIKKKNKIPYYVVAHGAEIIQNKFSLYWLDRLFFQGFIQKVVYRNADGIFTNSEYVKNLVKENISKSIPIHVTYCGIDPDEYFKTEKNYELIGEKYKDSKIILTISRLVLRKGIDNVIFAFKKYITKYPEENVYYFIGGRGPDEARLHAIVSNLRINDKVIFLGFIPQEEKKIYLNLANVFVMPSREEVNGDVEGFGIAYLEANACGVPIIGGNSGGIPSAIKDNVTGLLVDPLDINDIMKKIHEVLNNKELAVRLSKTGREYVENFYNWKSVGRRFLDVLQNK